MAVAELEFRAMASAGKVLVVDGPSNLTALAARRANELEHLWSRFVPTSDIARINRSPGNRVPVDPTTIQLVRAMVEAWHLTAGSFDPTILPALLGHGYTSSITDGHPSCEIPPHARLGGDLDEIAIDGPSLSITLPNGMALDPGGLGKGLAADLIVAELLASGAAGAMVSLGGDLRIEGRPPPEGWMVEVEHAEAPDEALCTLSLERGGVATSSVRSRTWAHEGGLRHHLIDPATGQQAGTDLDAVTVVAASAWQAEAIATQCLLAGFERARGVLSSHDVDGIAIAAAGQVVSTIAALDLARHDRSRT